jgi:hypothetical protein
MLKPVKKNTERVFIDGKDSTELQVRFNNPHLCLINIVDEEMIEQGFLLEREDAPELIKLLRAFLNSK